MSGTDAHGHARAGGARLRRGWAACAFAALGVSLFQHALRPVEAAPAPPLTLYDRDHPAIDYSGDAARNAIAELETRIGSGAVVLDETAGRGYLDAFLDALEIPASSQVLVFSKTSLQAAHIDAKHPRAIYFNDSTYVGWVQGTDHLEIVTIDSDRGPVFFSVTNAPPRQPQFERQSALCLACHDSAGLRGGGVPFVLVRSSSVAGEMSPAGRAMPMVVTHATAIEDRWGGWYVTGRLGVQQHLGNLPLAGPPDATVSRISNRSNLPSLADYIDTAPYMSDKSDIVALLVLEHQSYVHNLITRAKYALAGRAAATRQVASWADLPSDDGALFTAVLEPLAAAMTFQDERRLLGSIRGNARFEAEFVARGHADECGRTLRDFELVSRTFKYPLSFLVYAPAFQSLPPLAKRYLYDRFVALLGAPTGAAALDRDRTAALEILAATLPEFAGVATPRLAPAHCG
jgi:hypothetical protein